MVGDDEVVGLVSYERSACRHGCKELEVGIVVGVEVEAQGVVMDGCLGFLTLACSLADELYEAACHGNLCLRLLGE